MQDFSAAQGSVPALIICFEQAPEQVIHMAKKVKVKGYNSITRLREMVSILRRHNLVHGLTPEKLRSILEDLGPTFVKLGQIMSMRSDMLPQEYCHELRKLHRAVVPMPIWEVERLLTLEFGDDWSSVFHELSREPFGSASIAQVHRAVLTDGSPVVLKVQRPNIRERMSKDILFLRRALRVLDFVPKISDTIDFNMLLDEMWAVAQKEMDFLVEAHHLKRFGELNEKVAFVTCPKVYLELSTEKVLVMQFIDGADIDDEETLTSLGYDMAEIGAKLADNYVKQILDDGFFHADPHPGNIRVFDGKIIWLDLGMMGSISDRDRGLFKRAVMSIVQKDVYELEMALLSIGVTKGKIAHTELYEDINLFLMKYGEASLAELDLGQVMSELLEVAGKHRIAIPPGITMLARGIMTIEGVLAACSPETNFIEILAARYTDVAPSRAEFARELGELGKKLYSSAGKSVEIPGHLADILKMSVRGQTKLNLEITGSEEPIRKLSKIVDRLIIGIIDAALLIASSLICMTNMQPQLFDIPLIGVFGYASALFLAVWLLLSIKKR